jgi:hypothetical protein
MVKEMRVKLDRLKKSLPIEVEAALYTETQIEATECKKRCPVGPPPVGGHLRASIHAVKPQWEENRVFSLIACGGPSAPYAIAVHEHLSVHSPPSWQPPTEVQWNVPGTGPKFIESVILESRKYMGQRVARRIEFTRWKKL